ncbi:MAG: FAD-dependent oxidoreductase, partial [Rhodospirillaceae bacterium]|nr:FAD-dependent oxidoreductase [Rhodospirillaceae bacterium]
KTVSTRHLTTGEDCILAYDKLILCTGSIPITPAIPGCTLSGITGLNTLAEADTLRALAESKTAKNAVILGGGLIGVESCEALTNAGLNVTIVERMPQILGSLDPEIAKLVEAHVRAKGAQILTDCSVTAFSGENGKLTTVHLADGRDLPCDIAIMATGITPNTALAKAAGLAIGETGGIAVDAHMCTSDPDIFAAGDCVEITNRITGKKTLAPYGDLANLEGRIAADNAILGPTSTFPGTIDSGICKVFDFSAASTGLSETRARAAGFDVVTAVNASPDKPDFMGACLLVSKIVAEAKTGRVLGYQCIGPGSVTRQVATAAAAIAGGLSVDEMGMLDLPYAPPYSLAIDHVIASAHIVQNKMHGLMTGISSLAVKAKLDAGETPFLLDVRAPDEYEQMRLGLGETLIPLGKLRQRLADLPDDTTQEIIVYCKISMRGYEAQRILEAKGYRNVTVMEGGIMAWPFPREK